MKIIIILIFLVIDILAFKVGYTLGKKIYARFFAKDEERAPKRWKEDNWQ